ncbi:GMC family oxidoreductase N-terminal domain-containing protein [Nocardia otitidiscaviarum]|uniref:GMC family oxidoreductase n=1 Tax=Nocardia otitidiscaviarum TaxID=1823 RepID=UPI0004A716CA|nr:GMC family oxidoreductase N-terminal domain-containing protein [Nocardia otitidiscaviarum]MBF6132088.1 GMC family oxidoreductase N-terminal domain-containing protein [Nocardia otitidiscaviarum]MBF6483218.1 GMC family oxidoreductase N-terminal domain-containing protein [Nocardia otitidiscaviarum]
MPSSDSYDFVIVGGGTAGCVLAARLTEDENLQVLLLEAGAARLPDAVAHPPAWPTLANSSAGWGDLTVPQHFSGAPVPLPRGRGLGGSSAINAMVFARGHRTSYDGWNVHGARGWTYDDLLPYFQRSETAVTGAPGRGTAGPLIVGPTTTPNEILRACLAGAIEVGFPRAIDISGGLEDGFAPVDLNICAGQRQSAADAYLRPALGRPNLRVITGASAQRLFLEGQRCTGVEYRVGDEIRSVIATSEVVLAAGTIGSAQLLLCSGIGPESVLRDANVAVVHPLPGVGRNLHDHPRINLVHSSRRLVPTPRANHGEVVGLLRSNPHLPGPDVQIIFIDIPLPNPVAAVPNGFTIGVSPMLPVSRGYLRITSADPSAPPVFDPGYFTAAADVEAALAGIEAAREIAGSAALAGWGVAEVAPGLAVTDEAVLRDYARRNFSSYCHPVGTCAMGEDESSVVNSELRVHGLEGLRIADGSVIPAIPSANTNATVYAIAERAADLLRKS